MRLPTFEQQKAAGAYAGWGDTEARADFRATGGQDTPDPNQQAQQQATQQYQQGIQTAVTGLSTQKSNLATQYGDLLKTVTDKYQPLINTATGGINENLAARGITNNSPYYTSQMTSGLSPIYGQEAGNAQAIAQGSISDYNTLTNAIAQMQAGAAGTSSQLPLQYGSLAMNQALNVANIGNIGAQAAATTATGKLVPTNFGLYDTTTGQFVGNTSNLPTGGQVVNKNGQYFLSVP